MAIKVTVNGRKVFDGSNEKREAENVTFDAVKTGKTIRSARIAKNMTQMNLADAMGVSYQAVSNWERGNSMPDIAKLGELCEALGLTLDELMGVQPAGVVTKVMGDELLTVEELRQVAPILPPDKVKEQVKAERKKIDLSALSDIVPFLDDEFLDELLEGAVLTDLDGLEDIAPFLGEERLAKLIDTLPEDIDFGNFIDSIEELAPFLGKETLDKIVEIAPDDALDGLEDVMPFLSEESCNRVARRCVACGNYDALSDMAPFLSNEVLDAVVDHAILEGGVAELEDLYPFLGKQSLRKLARYLMHEQDFDSLEDIMPFVK